MADLTRPLPAGRRSPARHRFGAPGLRHSRELCAIPTERGKPKHAAVPAQRRHVRSATFVVVVGTVLISGWFAAAGAVAFAEMLSP